MIHRRLLTACAVAFAMMATVAMAQNNEGIRVSGNGVAWGTPDTAEFTVGINTLDPDVSAATEESNRIARAIISAMTEAGVAPSDVRTSSFNVYREDRRNDAGEQLEPAFRVINSVNVTVRDTAMVGELLALALDNGANQVNSLNFTISDTAELRAAARELAVQDATTRARQLAELTGVELGAPIYIEEFQMDGVPYQDSRGFAMMAESSTVPIEAGELSVEVSVSIVFAIQQD